MPTIERQIYEKKTHELVSFINSVERVRFDLSKIYDEYNELIKQEDYAFIFKHIENEIMLIRDTYKQILDSIRYENRVKRHRI